MIQTVTSLVTITAFRETRNNVKRYLKQSNRGKEGSANEVNTGPICHFMYVCVSGLFFKASDWVIYSLLTVLLAPYLSN